MSNEMTCADVEPLLDEYAANELTEQENAAVVRHLAACADCRAALHELRELGRRISALPAATAPDDLLAMVQAKLANQRPGLDTHATAPSGWLADEIPTSAMSDVDEAFLRFARIAA